jgi:hypothetical protein
MHDGKGVDWLCAIVFGNELVKGYEAHK